MSPGERACPLDPLRAAVQIDRDLHKRSQVVPVGLERSRWSVNLAARSWMRGTGERRVRLVLTAADVPGAGRQLDEIDAPAGSPRANGAWARRRFGARMTPSHGPSRDGGRWSGLQGRTRCGSCGLVHASLGGDRAGGVAGEPPARHGRWPQLALEDADDQVRFGHCLAAVSAEARVGLGGGVGVELRTTALGRGPPRPRSARRRSGPCPRSAGAPARATAPPTTRRTVLTFPGSPRPATRWRSVRARWPTRSPSTSRACAVRGSPSRSPRAEERRWRSPHNAAYRAVSADSTRTTGISEPKIAAISGAPAVNW